MAGGGGGGIEGLSDSILEVPTYALALVFLFFLLGSYAFELAIHWLSHTFERWGRVGLVEALEKLVMELTLLGFVSLVLLLFQNSISKLCVTYSDSLESWTLLSNIEGCPCCLAHTKGVSLCAQIGHGCLFNSTSYSRTPYCGCEAADPLAVEEDCNTYDIGERVFYMEQLVPSVVAGAELFQATSETTADELCDLLCGLVQGTYNGTFSSSSFVDDSAGGMYDLSLDGLDKSMTAKQGRRLLSLPDLEAHEFPCKASALLGPLWMPAGSSFQQRRLLGVDGLAANGTDSGHDSETVEHVVPKLTSFHCSGSMFSGSCPDGKVPAISPNAMNQVHLWLFLIAIFHVVVSIFMIVLAGWRLRQWRRWQEKGLTKELMGGTQEDAEAGGSKGRHGGESDDEEEEEEEEDEESGEGATPGSQMARERSGWPDGEKQQQQQEEQEQQQQKGESTMTEATSGSGVAGSNGVSRGNLSGSQLSSRQLTSRQLTSRQLSRAPTRILSRQATEKQNLRSLRKTWMRRDTMIRSKRGLLMEAATCLLQALWPNVVTRHEFHIVRSGYIASACPPEPFDFVSRMLSCLEHDASQVVGLGLEMWLLTVILVLVSGVWGWSGAIFLYIAAALLLGVNVALVAMLRYACRGHAGKVLQRNQGGSWLAALLRRMRPRWLLIPIRMTLFMCSMVFSSVVFFAWQFGSQSCLFEDADMWSFADVLPWWVSLIIAFIILLSVSFVTLPTYSLVVHSTPFQRMQHGAQQAQQAQQAQHGGESAAQEGPQGQQPLGDLSGEDGDDDYMVEGLGPATRALVTKMTIERREQVAAMQAEVVHWEDQVASLQTQVERLEQLLWENGINPAGAS